MMRRLAWCGLACGTAFASSLVHTASASKKPRGTAIVTGGSRGIGAAASQALAAANFTRANAPVLHVYSAQTRTGGDAAPM